MDAAVVPFASCRSGGFVAGSKYCHVATRYGACPVRLYARRDVFEFGARSFGELRSLFRMTVADVGSLALRPVDGEPGGVGATFHGAVPFACDAVPVIASAMRLRVGA